MHILIKSLKQTLIFVCLFLAFQAFGQADEFRRISLKFDGGRMQSHLYNNPIQFNQCFEGCRVTRQAPLSTFSFNMNVYVHLNQNNSIKIATGFSQHGFIESGFITEFLENDVPYETEVSNAYIDYALGYRYTFLRIPSLDFYAELDALYQVVMTSDLNPRNGFGVQPCVGTYIILTPRFGFNVEAFYRSAITAHASGIDGQAYIPNAYGLSLGFQVKL